MSAAFLLIGTAETTAWFEILKSVLSARGDLHVLPEAEALQDILHHAYDLIIVDAAIVEDEKHLVTKLRARQARARIIVLTASPTWRRAREALRAGAMDYLNKSLTQDEFAKAITAILSKTPPTLPIGSLDDRE